MRRPLLVTAAALVALAAAPTAAPAASQAARIAKLERTVKQLQRTVNILQGRINNDRQLIGILSNEYLCTPYLLLDSAASPRGNNGTWNAWRIPEREWGTVTYSSTSVNCGAAPPAPAAAPTRKADAGTAAPDPDTAASGKLVTPLMLQYAAFAPKAG